MRMSASMLVLTCLLIAAPAQAVTPVPPPGHADNDVVPSVWSNSSVSANCIVTFSSDVHETQFDLVTVGGGWGLFHGSIGSWKSRSAKVQWQVDCTVNAKVEFGGTGGAYREVLVTTTLSASPPMSDEEDEKTKHGSCSYGVLPNSCQGEYTLDAVTLHVQSGVGKKIPAQVELCIKGSAKVEGGSQIELLLDPFATDTHEKLDGADGCANYDVTEPEESIQSLRAMPLPGLEGRVGPLV